MRDLQIALASSEKSALPVVVGASFDIAPKSITGILGESGSGKTTLALSLLGLLDPNRYSVSGSILLNGTELMGLPERQMERVRGAIIGIIPQDSLLGLNPVLRVQRQMTEAIRAHSACEAIQPEAALTLAGLEPSRRILNAYPHQLSGGERQRVSIALALASRPSLVIADEPFTALDGPRTLELASVFKTIREQIGVSFLLIDHSPGVMARIAEQALVMYAGRIVERGTPHQLLAGPLHPYTSALLRQWRTHAQGQEKRRFSIPGNPPALEDRRTGCPFEPRCDARLRSCVQADPPEMIVAARRSVRCFALDSEAGQQGGHAS